jgi:3-phosphoshikimate 1-carboxyvinyltransferase
MHERPFQDLIDALVQLGVDVRSEEGTGCPPVVIEADGLPAAAVTIRGDVSSQFLSALLMAAPCARGSSAAPVFHISIDGPLVSRPYVTMTLAVMRAFGAQIESSEQLSDFRVGLSGYVGCQYEIEPDASAASYFWAAAAIVGGRVRVEGLTEASLQGDVAFCECLRQMGCQVQYDRQGTTVVGGPLHGIDVDMNAISDTVQTLAAVALFAKGPTNIRGVGHIRHKETDRIAAVATELRKFGADVEERPDGLRITPQTLHGASIDTYHDHRMAMSMALVGLRVEGVVINDPGCTAKTYPRFFDDLRRVCR